MNKKKYLKMWFTVMVIVMMFVCVGCEHSVDNDASIQEKEVTDSMSNDDMNSEYFTIELRVKDGTPFTSIAEVNFDGNGNVTVNDLEISDEIKSEPVFGAIADNASSENVTTIYSVADDGLLTVGSEAEGVPIVGQVSVDANLFCLADTDISDNDIGITFGIKRSSGMKNADLIGTYTGAYFVLSFNDEGAIEFGAEYTDEFMFDGLGNALDYEGEPTGCTYTVSDNGTITIYDEDGELMENTFGQASADGKTLLYVAYESGMCNIFIVGQQNSNNDISNLSGTYEFVGFNYSTQGICEAARGTFMSDGSGLLTITNQVGSKNSIEKSDNIGISNITEGVVIFENDMKGQMIDNGNFIILPDIVDDEDETNFVIGICKSLK